MIQAASASRCLASGIKTDFDRTSSLYCDYYFKLSYSLHLLLPHYYYSSHTNETQYLQNCHYCQFSFPFPLASLS